MDYHEIHSTLAEIGITLTTLSCVAGLIETSIGDPKLAGQKRLQLRDVAVCGIAVMLLSVLPMLFQDESPWAAAAWRGLSAFGLVWWVASAFVATRLEGRVVVWWYAFVSTTASIVGVGLLAWTVASPQDHAPERYTAALVLLLVIGALNFLDSVFSYQGGRPEAVAAASDA